MKKTCRKLFGIFLGLVMVLGLMPGMGLTAYAEDSSETINKATPTANDFTYSAPSDLTYDGNSKTAIVVPTEGITGMGEITVQYYSDAACTSVVENPIDVGTYYVGITVAEGDNYSAVSDVLHGDNWNYTITGSSTVDVTGVSLEKTTAELTVDGNPLTLTATVSPNNATDKTVKWSVGGTDAGAVKLYSDADCTTEVGTDATDKLTVYAKGISAGSATITATSNADSEKKASCDVTVNTPATNLDTQPETAYRAPVPYMALNGNLQANEHTIGNAAYTIDESGVLTVGSGEFTIENWASVFGTGGTKNTPNDTAKSIKSVIFQEGAVLTSTSTSMRNMFRSWESLESADLTNLTASNVTDMTFMFRSCASLTSVTFGAGVETSKVQYMSQMFQDCSSLTDLDLSTFKVYTGTGKRSLYQTFYGCSNLVTIRVSDDWYIPKNPNSGNALVEGTNTFNGCNKLEGGKGTKAYGFGDYSYAVIDGKDNKQGYFTSASAPVEHRHEFTYSASGSTLTATCSADDCGLTDNKVELTLTPPAKTVYGDSNSATATLEGREAFNEATGLKIGSWQTYEYYKKGSDNQLGAAPTTPGEYTVKVTISNVAGSSYTLTADYTIAQKEIGLTWADTTFHYDGKSHVPTATATGLVDSDKCDVTVIGEQTAIGTYTATASGLSNDWYKLPENTTTKFAIEGWVGTARYTIEDAPSPNRMLFSTRNIPHDITGSVLTIYGGEFNNAEWKTAFANDDFITNTRDKITSVRFVKANGEDTAAKLTDSAQGMFQNWSKLESIDFTNLDTSSVTWMGTMFSECSSLTELDLSPLDTRNVINMGSMFYKCSKLEKITVGANWKTASSTSYMFSGCNELAGNAGTTYKKLFGNYINTGDGAEFLPDVNGTYAHVDKGTIDPGFFYNAHQHHLTYTVDQSKPWTITATCDADGCYLGDSNTHSVSISLVKPTLYVYWMDELNKKGDKYDKGASPLATLTMQNVGDQTLQDSTTVADPDGKINGVSFSVSTFNDANTAAPDFEELTGATIGEIKYYEKDSNVELGAAPKEAGTYTAKVTIGDATASVDYRIAKRFHSPVTTSPQAAEDLVSDGTTAKALVTAGAVKKVDDTDTSALQYALGTGMTIIPTEGWSKDIPTATAVGDYYVFYKVVGDKNHGDAMQSEFPNKSGYAGNTYNKPAFSVIKVTMIGVVTAPEAKQLTYNGKAQELVTAGEAHGGKMYYAVTTENTAPTDDNLYTTDIPTETEAGTYYVWYKVVGDENHNVTEPESVTVTIGPNVYAIVVDNQEWQKGSSGNLTITFKGTYADERTYGKWNEKVLIDGAVISTASYDHKAGSLVIDLKPAYLETLSTGKHTISVTFSDGSASGTFNIKAKSSSGGGSTPKKDNVVTCQMAGFPANYAWNEAAKACQPGYLDNNGVFHPASSGKKSAVPNTNDKGLMGSVVSLSISMITAIIAAFLLKKH